MQSTTFHASRVSRMQRTCFFHRPRVVMSWTFHLSVERVKLLILGETAEIGLEKIWFSGERWLLIHLLHKEDSASTMQNSACV